VKGGKGEKGNRLFSFDVLYRILFMKKSGANGSFFFGLKLRQGLSNRDFTPSNFSVESEALLCNNSAGRTCRVIESQKR
jgi:hypothetical protein